MPCSLWSHVDLTKPGAAKVRVETTCSVYGPSVAEAAGRWLLEPKGGKLVLEYTVPWSGRLIETPCSPGLLPQPWPPYSMVDASIVIDSKPGLLLYGLPARKSTVITLTERTLLEGRTSSLQVVEVDEADAVGEAEAYVNGWLIVATVPPLRARLAELEEARECAAGREGLEAWAKCLWERGRGYSEALLEDASRHPWTAPCLYGRLYAGSLWAAGLDPLYWLRRVRSEAGPWSPLRRRGRVLYVYAPRARIVLAKKEDKSLIVNETTVEEGVHVLEGWDAVGLACRNCLEPLR